MNNILAAGLLVVAFCLNIVETKDLTLTLISYVFLAIAALLAKDWIKNKINELL